MPTGSGYYFARLISTFLICSTGTGTVEEFTIAGDEQSLTGACNVAELQTRKRNRENRTVCAEAKLPTPPG